MQATSIVFPFYLQSMSIKYPKISIITPTYNQGQYIEQSITSVLSQNYPNLEFVIIDGGSTDNTIDILKKYADQFTYWVTEKDEGQSNAINKGLKYCTGEIFNWLNSDDFLEPGALQKIAEAFNDNTVDLVAGKVNNFSSHKSNIESNQHLSAGGLMRWDNNVQLLQPGVWMRRKYFINCGGVNEQFHYSFDWDMLIRYLYFYPKVKYLDYVLVNFRFHESSKTVSAPDKFVNEEKKIIENLYTDTRYEKLHPVCKWKIERSYWTTFLIETANASGNSKTSKIYTIIKHLNRQPSGAKIKRMTLGAIKQILLS